MSISEQRTVSRDTETAQEPEQASLSDAPKRPYEKPAFRSERVFETMALACGKIAGSTQGNCHSLVKLS